MRSYKFARRSFLQGIGAGAIGLRVMLRNLEASAQGMTPPPRFLMTHWPVGTVHYVFKPVGTGTAYTTSRILKPFEDAGLRNDMAVLYGMQTNSMTAPGGGGHEAGTSKTTTGANSPGTRKNGGEGDDAAAGGPSWDQIFLKNVTALQTPGQGYVNAICDARVDSLETSTQCLSYGYTTRSIAAANVAGNITENVPLLPTLSPLSLYNQLFKGFMPGGTSTPSDTTRLLRARKSVLDASLSQLTAMRGLAPASEWSKIDAHGDAIRKIETQLTAQIAAVNTPPSSACAAPMAPAASLLGKTGSHEDYDPNKPTPAPTADDDVHAQIGAAHWGIIQAAFQCDLIRVATFQWSPGTNHVSFKDQMPNQPAGSIFMHHPTSHLILDPAQVLTSLPPAGQLQDVANFLVNIQIWYNTQMATLLNRFKSATDVFGGNLLANTIVPYVTEVAMTTHQWSPLPAMIFGGSALGMKGGQYQDFSAKVRNQNDMWMAIAQAYFKTINPLANLSSEVFYKNGVTPIAGLWAAP
jgi:hypothetical protein